MSTIDATIPDEVVTNARVRVIDLPLAAGRMALITLDNDRDHTRPSTFGPAGLALLDAALDQITAMTDISAVGITGKPFVFAVGADLSSKMLHLAWHPGAPVLAAAASNSLYLYHATGAG